MKDNLYPRNFFLGICVTHLLMEKKTRLPVSLEEYGCILLHSLPLDNNIISMFLLSNKFKFMMQIQILQLVANQQMDAPMCTQDGLLNTCFQSFADHPNKAPI